MNRDTAIDLSRAIAVMLVTLFHVSRGPMLPTLRLGDFDLFGFMRNGWVGVGIFFIISGYCMGMSSERDFLNGVTFKGYARYILKRFMRIAPPYYFAIAIWVFIIDEYGIAKKPTGAWDILTHMTFIHNLFPETFFSISGVFWSIAVEMQFYLVLPLIIILCRGFYSSCIVLSLTLAASIFVYNSNLGIQYKWGLFNYLFLFVYGWVLYTYRSTLFTVIDRMKLHYVSGALFVVLILYVGGDLTNEQKMFELVLSILFGVIMLKMNDMQFIQEKSPLRDVFLLIGKASFSIYLYNYIYNFMAPRNDSFLALVFTFLGVIGFGVLMYLLIELNTERVRRSIFKPKRKVETSAV